MKPEKVAKDLRELALLRKTAARIPDYQPGKVRVSVDFQQPISSFSEKQHFHGLLMDIVKNVLTPEEVRDRMTHKVNTRIAALEAKYPGLVDEG
jgi:hypothetical protein